LDDRLLQRLARTHAREHAALGEMSSGHPPVGCVTAPTGLDFAPLLRCVAMETKNTTPPYIPQIRRYQNWLRDQRGLQFDSYDALWRWSTTELDAFWQSVWDYF